MKRHLMRIRKQTHIYINQSLKILNLLNKVQQLLFQAFKILCFNKRNQLEK